MSAAKRPRLSGSFSPASPPYHLAKGVEQRDPNRPVQQPNTPTSPPKESMAVSQQQIPGLSNFANAAPSMSAASTVNTQLTEDTPASSVAGTVSFAPHDKDGDAVMSEDFGGAGETTDGGKKDSHMRTDHERIQEGLKFMGREEQLREFLLNVDVGPVHRLCEQPHSRSNPHPTQNLISLFNLKDIAKSVERKDPITGVKTNKLRKSYENQIKTLNIAGRNKAIDGGGDFEDLLRWPGEEYRNQRVHGKTIESGLSSAFETRLERAFGMPAPQTRLPEQETERWKTLIGTEEPPKLARHPLQQGHDGVVVSAPAVGVKQHGANAAGRPERTGKKRSYKDSSFAGYGDGWGDENIDLSEDDMALARRKRQRA